MDVALYLVGLAVGVLAGVAAARWIGVPAPLFLVVAGAAASYLPFVPEIHLEPEVVLLGLLPPLLYSAAITSSLVAFKAQRRAIGSLAVGLVVFTTIGVALVAHLTVPGLSWPMAFALGAVVAPPDAVAATAIGRRIGLPRRVVTILEGESLFNDATALVLLRSALMASIVSVEAWRLGTDFALSAGGGVLIGILTFGLVRALRRRAPDTMLDVAISFVVPFAAFIAAEQVHASGVVAVVVAGLLLGHGAQVLQTVSSRIAEQTNWRAIAFVLENVVFALIGLQARWLFEDLGASTFSPARIATASAATLAAVILLRIVWVFLARYLFDRPGPDPVTGEIPSWRSTFLLGWAGMRGVVTLAAALLIPEDTPHREVLVAMAFSVVAGTLLIQGLTLPVLTRLLRVPSPDPLDDALARATLLQQASKAAHEELDRREAGEDAAVCVLIRQRMEQRNLAAWERLGTASDRESPAAAYYRIRMAMIAAERRRILEIREVGNVPAEVVADVLSVLDVEESMLDNASQERDESLAYERRRRAVGGSCPDLDRYPAVDAEPATECPTCVSEGTTWVSLRRCLECGAVGCCDSSPRHHATTHFHQTSHPVMQSAEKGEEWRWCYVHHLA